MLKALTKYLKEPLRYRGEWFILILVIFYGVGLVGLNSASSDWFLATTPFILLLSAGLMVGHHKGKNGYYWTVMLICFAVGYGVEVLGVKTGVIFGDYSYGETLGFKWQEVPLVIGVNWLLLVGATGALVARWGWIHPIFRAAISALLMTGLDWLIEPAAIKLGFWNWASEAVPLQNYLAWFGISFVLLALYHMLPFQKRNKVGTALFFLQLIFFGTLSLIL